MAEDEKQCPRCAETVKAAAAVCRFCGFNFSTGKSPQPRPVQQIMAGPRQNSFQSCMGCFGIGFVALMIVGSLPSPSKLFPSSSETEAAASDQAIEPSPKAGVEGGRPVLVGAGIDAAKVVKTVGAPWDGEPLFDRTNYTDSVKLDRRLVVWPMGSITVDRASSGGIYYILLRTGSDSRCGDPAALGKAFVKLTTDLGLALPSTADMASIMDAWKKPDGDIEVEAPGVEIKAFGGCTPAFSMKAI